MLDTELIAAGPSARRTAFSSPIMKHTLFVSMFVAASLAAQGSEKARTELANPIAVEEQERDLAKAEKLYHTAIDDPKLSADAHALAKERLGRLLQRLGRDAEAKQFLATDKGAVVTLDDVTNGLVTGGPQDAERTKALREKARELVKLLVQRGQQERASPAPMDGLDATCAQQLLWIGEPAVPEVAAYLESVPKASSYHSFVVSALASFLWRVGGAKAAAFLREVERIDTLRLLVAAGACAAMSPEMLDVAAEYLRLPDPGLAETMLDETRWGSALRSRLDSALLIDVMGKGSVSQRTWLLRWATDRQVESSQMPKLLEVVRASLTTTEPELGTAAQSFLTGPSNGNDVDVIELMLEQVASPPFIGCAPQNPSQPLRLDRERAQRWVVKIDACIGVLGAMREEPRFGWIATIASAACEPLDASVMPTVLRWLDAGYPYWIVGPKMITAANAAEVFARFDRFEDSAKDNFLGLFAAVELPSDLFPTLRAKADEMAAKKWSGMRAFAMPMARTGNPDAAAWLLDDCRRRIPEGSWGPDALIVLIKRTQDERVRAAIRTVVEIPQLNFGSRCTLLLALLSLGDLQSLGLVVETLGKVSAARNPFARAENPAGITPLEYLVYPEPDPAHGIPDTEIVGIMPALAKRVAQSPQSMPGVDAQRVSARVLIAGAEAGISTFRSVGQGVLQSASWRDALVVRLQREDPPGELHAWLDDALRTRNKAVFGIVEKLDGKEIARIRPQLDAFLAGDDADLAEFAFDHLARTSQPLDFDALMQSKHDAVRDGAFWRALERNQLSNDAAIRAIAKGRGNDRIAQYLGSRVAVEAVPALIGLLKDPIEGVRTAAAEALTKIRFHHEQQAYWDRIVKGLDASPASAAEKLLLQAKPGAAKAQRLLAIQSLGTLGVPEALPFLIDWTQDADADVAKAAKDAITQIHLNPRK